MATKRRKTTAPVAEPTVSLPVVCLPGIRGDATVFSRLEATAPAVTWVPLDLPPGAPALAASRLWPHLPSGRFHVLTGSYGGLVARFLPTERVASLACVGTLPSPVHLRLSMVRRARVLLRLPDALLETFYARHTRSSLRAEGLPESLVEALLRRPVEAAVLRGRLRGVLSGHHGECPDVPTAVVQGALDGQVGWSDEDIRRVQPHAAILQVEGGHFPHASHPEAFWDVLCAEWWPRVDTRT